MSGLGLGGLFLQAGGAVSSAIGSYYSGRIQKLNMQHQAEMAKINARLSELGAQSALLQGQRQVGALTLQSGQLKSRQRAALAANGVSLSEGSAVELQASTDIMTQIDANTIEANAVRAAWGQRIQSMNFQNEAIMQSATAGAINPGMSAFSSLLGSAGSVASSWYQYNKGK